LATTTTDGEIVKNVVKVRSPIKMKQLVSPGKAQEKKAEKGDKAER